MNELPPPGGNPALEELLKKFPQDSGGGGVSVLEAPRGNHPIGWSSEDVYDSSLMFLIFGLILFVIMAVLLYFKHPAMDVLRLCALPLIIVAAVFLVVVGYSSEQIAPVLGLLASIAGYLLGTARRDPLPPQQEPPAGGAPVPGAPVPGAPVPGAPVPGAPVPGAPVPGAPVPGAPAGGALPHA